MLLFGDFVTRKEAAHSSRASCLTSQTFNSSLTREPNDAAKVLKILFRRYKIAHFSHTGSRHGRRDLDVGEKHLVVATAQRVSENEVNHALALAEHKGVLRERLASRVERQAGQAVVLPVGFYRPRHYVALVIL